VTSFDYFKRWTVAYLEKKYTPVAGFAVASKKTIAETMVFVC